QMTTSGPVAAARPSTPVGSAASSASVSSGTQTDGSIEAIDRSPAPRTSTRTGAAAPPVAPDRSSSEANAAAVTVGACSPAAAGTSHESSPAPSGSAVTGLRDGSGRTVTVRCVDSSRSMRTSRPNRDRPEPVISLTASMAIIEPTVPQSAPTTPASAQLGTEPAGGGAGYRSRNVTASAGAGGRDQKTASWARKRSMVPQISGIPAISQASETRYRVAKLSLPSSTR